jgi:ribosomal protein L12E/L44/L45/RPP1/RPP2
MLQMAQVVDQVKGTNMAEQIAVGITGGVAPASAGSEADAEESKALGGANSDEHPIAQKARQRVAESTDPT